VFHRVTIRVADLEISERFYDTVLETLGIDRRRSELSIEPRDGEHPVTRDLHMTFRGSVSCVRVGPDGNRVEIVS
jgi:hypothetical protein